MEHKRIVLKFVDGKIQLPDDIKKNLEEIANWPITYSDDCPELTDEEISEFRRTADYTFDTKTKTFHPKVQNG